MASRPPTTLVSKGSTLSPAEMKELGSKTDVYIPDVVPQLVTLASAIREYEKMVNGDATVDVSLRGAKTPILAATFFIDPFDGEQENLDIKEFVEYNLFDEFGPLNFIEDCLRMFEYGYSVFECVWGNESWAPARSMANRKTYTMLKKLAARPATTVSRIDYDDNGELIQIIQQAIGAGFKTREVILPADKIVTFTFNGKSGQIHGKSLLRTAYKHWYYKEHLYKIDAIQKERHGIGVPDIALPPGYTQGDKDTAHELGRNLRTNEKAYIVRPPGIEVGFARLEGQPVDILRSIEHHNSMIMLNVMMEFLLLGLESSGGGRATSASQLDMFLKSLKYISNYVCEQINRYVIPQLVEYNFDTDKYPTLEVRNIGETKDLQAFASALANLAAQELITLDIETEQWVREQFDMPAKVGPRPELTEAANRRINELIQVAQASNLVPGQPQQQPQQNGAAQKGNVKTSDQKGTTGGGNLGKLPGEG